MSGTGVKIFSNDMAMDVKYDFCQLYGIGKSIEEINNYIFRYRPEDDDEEACAFWSALALVEWQHGVLSDDIKSEAKRIIENHDDAHLFIKQKDADARKTELKQLLELLETENPAPKKRKKTYVYRTPYKQGDVIAFPVKERWMYFHVCGIKRSAKKIKELEQDQVYVGLFNLISKNIVDISRIEKTAASEAAYISLDRPGVSNFVRWIYPLGIKEQTEFEKKCVVIGNLPCDFACASGVHFGFQFKCIEQTLIDFYSL